MCRMTDPTPPAPPPDALGATSTTTTAPPAGAGTTQSARVGATTAAGAAAGGRHEPGGHLDTVESILIAFILAFVFRAFVVEAFVIPTGSMAPTLLGAHARFTCDDCGYKFEVNYSTPGGQGGEDQSIPAAAGPKAFTTTPWCPNCGLRVALPNRVPIHYGDRILVLKYAYLFSEPRRWDVVVFKSPDAPERPSDNTGLYTTNFIKRLVGRPGETLMVLDGDIYVSTNGKENLADFKVQSKPRHVQDALWRVVYDNDFLPRPRNAEGERTDWSQPWKQVSGSGWDLGTDDQPSRVFTFNGAQAAGTIRFDSEANDGNAFTDRLAYAQSDSGRNNVSDAMVRFVYERADGAGPLRVQLTKLGETFTAELTPQGATLYRKTGEAGGPDNLGEQVGSTADVAGLAAGGGPVMVEFMNVDYGVTLRVAGEDVLTARYEPDVAALKAAGSYEKKPKPRVAITAAEQRCRLSRISLWRDVYYTNTAARGSIQWATPSSPITLERDEYFVMGDNTVISLDARYWTHPVNLPGEDLQAQAGVVPERFLLGKAFFVYWPAGYRPLPNEQGPGAIPNFGAMRLIH